MLPGGLNQLDRFFVANAADGDEVFNIGLTEFLGREKSLFVEGVCHTDADTRQFNQRIIAALHGFTVTGLTVDIEVPTRQFRGQPDILPSFTNGD